MYALNLGQDGRVLSATYPQYAPIGAPVVDALPDGNIADYRYVGGAYVLDPLPEPEPEPDPQQVTDALLLDHEERLIYLELGVNE